MPEDQKPSVSEDPTETPPVDAAPDTEYDEEKAFGAETKEDEAEALGVEVGELEEKETRSAEEIEADAVVEKEADAKAKLEAAETPEEKVERETAEAEAKAKLEADEETDEDIIRGQELLDSAEKEGVKAKEEAKEEPPPPEDVEYLPSQHSNTAENMEFFTTAVPKKLLPEEPITLKDGTELDFGYYQKENPEFAPGVAAITKNIIDQMIANGALVGADVYEHVDNQLFFRTVAKSVKNHHEVYASENFKKWLPDQPEAIQALMKSKDPEDTVRVFSRFLNKEGLKEAKEKVVDIDKKRAAKKEKFDALHKSTVKSKRASKKSAVSNEALEEEGFTSTEDDDDF